MNVNGKHYKTVWFEDNKIMMINQNKLPFIFQIIACKNLEESCTAIKNMTVRGAGAIGVTAGFAMAQASMQITINNLYEKQLLNAANKIMNTRPTAKDLSYSVTRVLKAALMSPEKAYNEALSIAEENENACKKIGDYGNQIIENGFKIVTHCNAGWLAFVDYGSALSPIYTAKNAGKNIFVWVNETRPRLQGAKLTAWELKNENINHTIIPDNACAALMQKGEIHLMITGADRIANNGDTANKIGTLEKAIACKYFGIPFYVAAPLSTFDFEISSGNDIIIEERDEAEIIYAEGITQDNKLTKIQLCSPDSKAYNMAFDVTPAKLITGFITEKGIFTPQEIKLLCN